MKKTKIFNQFFAAFAIIIVFAACNDDVLQDNSNALASPQSSKAKGYLSESPFNVSLDMVKTFILVKNTSDKATENLKIESIEPIEQQNTALMYVVNYTGNNGWEIISADRRTEPILAFAETGKFNTKVLNEGEQFWLSSISDAICKLQKINDLEDTVSDNYQFWQAITEYNQFLETQQHNISITSIPIIKPHLLEVVIKPLTFTEWHQQYPYNTKCPLINGTHAVTGCGATAGAQMAYFLHYKIGVPQKAYNACSYRANASGGYTYTFSNPQASTWNLMPHKLNQSSGYDVSKVAILMAYVGYKTDMHWTTDLSSADMDKIVDYFDGEGVSCDMMYIQQNDRQQHTVINNCIIASLSNGFPVIVSSDSEDHSYGHTWIIDGYREKKFAVMIPVDSNLPMRIVDLKLQYYTMNWGFVNNTRGEFLINGTWTINGFQFNFLWEVF